MSQQMQQTNMPPHLRQYVGKDKPAFMPPSVQRELAAHMEKVMPAHLKQYAGAYVAQNMTPAPARNGTRPMTARSPVPDRHNLSHSGSIAAEQADATQYLNMFQPDAPNQPPQNTPQQPTPSSSTPSPEHPDYSFIMEPPSTTRTPKFNLGSGSPILRIAVVAGGIVLLLILFGVIKGVLTDSNKAIPSLVSVAQYQQELVHLATNGTQNAQGQGLKNFAYTAQLSLQSEQKDLITYLSNNGHKTSLKELNFKVSKTVDDQLATALTASSYDTTFKQAMQDSLTTYQNSLKQAYEQTSGPKGRALLQADFDAAQLLSKQLGS